jgi:hypothetical protein
MTLYCTDVIIPALQTMLCSTAVNIKNYLPHSIFKLKKSRFQIMFGDKPLIKYLYPFYTKCYNHVPEQKSFGISKLSPGGINSYVVVYAESFKIR